MSKKIFTSLILVILTAVSLNAWDGERRGFLLGIGFGAGYDIYSGVQYDSLGPNRESNASFAFAASPRIGYAFNNQMALLYGRHPLTFTVTNEADEDVQVTVCTEALQFNYYFRESAPSSYAGLGAGVGYFFDEETLSGPGMNYSSGSLKGPGVFALIGCEPIKHLSAELALHYRMPQEGSSEFAVSLLINVLGY